MSLLTSLRLVSRRLPVGPIVLHRLRRAAAIGFRLSAWAKYGRSRKPARPRPGPVCVAGFHGSVLGIGEAARAFSNALRSTGAEVIDWDISAQFGHQVRLDCAASDSPPQHATSMVVFLNPNELVQLVAMQGAAPFAGRLTAGAWFWELEQAPTTWRHGLAYVDEVWAGSRFTADAVQTLKPSIPIRVLPCPVTPPGAPPDRARFGLPEDKVVVLVAFDVRSGYTRKNPLASVRAFRKANRDGRAVMVCKAAGIEGAPELVDALRAEIGDAGDIRLMTDWLDGRTMQSLVAGADIVMSLHRSEGFGLSPAQAMAAGKAVIATGWSANLDFMTADNSVLVDYTLTPVVDPQGLYAGGRWAEPDVDDAAAKLEGLIGDRALRESLGRRAADDIRAMLDPTVIGAMAPSGLAKTRTEDVQIDRLAIPDVLKITPKRHGDARGWFSEAYRADVLAEAGVQDRFVQDNQAYSSVRGTLRGLHLQIPPDAISKLIRCLKGAIFDVAVDVRAGSPTYGQWVGAELTADNGAQLYVPRGFAHAYVTLTADTEVFYKCDGYYSPICERGLRFNDPAIGIDWPVAEADVVINDRDRNLPLLADFEPVKL